MLPKSSEDFGSIVHVLFCHDLVHVVRHERSINEKSDELESKEETGREEGVGYHFGENELKAA